MINLIDTDLFKDLTSIYDGNKYFDLHNSYECTNLTYDYESKSLKILFESRKIGGDNNTVCIIFNEATIVKFDFYLTRTNDSSTLNNFYRGRFVANEVLLEHSKLNEGYFYLEFEQGDKFEILAQKAFFFELKNDD